MKIVRIAGLHYKNATQGLDFQNKTYAEQQSLLFQKKSVYTDSFSRGMRALGYESEELVYDFELMQKRWAEEQGLFYDQTQWRTEILLGQIGKIQPDILFFQDIYALPYEIKKELKQRFPFLKLVVIFRGFPGFTQNLYQELATADLLLLGSPHLIPSCRAFGLAPHHIYHFFDEEILQSVKKDPSTEQIEEVDFSYVGSSGFGYGIEYLERYAYLKKLLETTPLEAWLDEPLSGKLKKTWTQQMLRKTAKAFFSFIPQKRIAQMQEKELFTRFRGVFEELLLQQPIPEKPLSENFCVHPPLFGMQMYQRLYRSRMTFNKHAGAARGTVDNIRMFQATGMGSCLLTDRGRNLGELFEEDREVVAYSSIEECIEKAKYLMDHEKVCREIAKKGQEKTLREHTLGKRCEQMHVLFQEQLRKKS